MEAKNLLLEKDSWISYCGPYSDAMCIVGTINPSEQEGEDGLKEHVHEVFKRVHTSWVFIFCGSGEGTTYDYSS